jgi:aldehyde dehydrogenase (NAD+)
MASYDKFYINGEWTAPNGSGQITVINPATEEVAGTVPSGDGVDADAAIRAARAAFEDWAALSIEERTGYVGKLAAEMAAQGEAIGKCVSEEQGMPLPSAINVQAGLPTGVMANYVEVGNAYAAAEPERIGNSEIVKEPIGVCSFITPWNYPLHQIVGKVAPALVAGCTMVLKPSSETPLNAYLFAEIVDKVGLPKGVFNLISGPGRTLGEEMCIHDEVDMISLTGSTTAGARIGELASRSIKRVCLELGGKSANVILDDADLAKAIPASVMGMMFNCGQTCSALTRMIVPKGKQDEIAAIAKGVAESISIGDPTDASNYMGPMVSKEQQETVQGYIRTGVEEGATLLTGGAEPPEGINQGYYVKPTIFTDVKTDMTIAQEEIFGPVLCILPYESEQEAIDIANDSIFGLSGGVWSGSEERARNVALQMRTGQVAINGGAFNLAAPFGGYKQSGNGRELGAHGLDEFLEVKALNL